MNKQELLDRYNNNQNQIKKLSSKLSEISVPIHQYQQHKNKSEDIEHSLTTITCRITSSGFLLALVPVLPIRLAGITILCFVGVCKGIILRNKLKDKELEKISKECTIEYNEIFKEQYKLIKEQEKLKEEIESLNNVSSEPNLISRLLDENRKLNESENSKSRSLNKNNLNKTFDRSESSNNDITTSVDFKSSLSDDDIYRTIEI